MNSPISHFLLFASLLGSAGCALAAEPNPSVTPVTLEALVAEVLASNPESQFYDAELAVARGEFRNAGTLANPELAIAAGRKRVASAIAQEGTAWSVSVRQSFDWPGRLALRKAIANRQIQLAEIGVAQFKVGLAARTRALALAVAAAQEQLAATREVAARFEALRDVLVQRDPAGLTPTLETRIIEATELTLQRRASEAAVTERSALFELNQLRGAAPAEPLRIERPSLLFPPAPPLEELVRAAREKNFELQARRVELEQQGFRVSLARNDRNGSFSVGPYVSREGAGDRETQFGIEATVPLPIWNRRHGDVAIAEARQRQAETVLLVAQRNLEREIAQHAASYGARVAEIARWRADSVTKFHEAAELADRHFRLGAVPIATYVELQKEYLEAVAVLLDTRRDALHAAQELHRLTGLAWHPSLTGGPGSGRGATP
ncbi:MAG: TolC family protein [Opitutaceae bacterium]|nr:TolC family protein [Opitutaceae bacterium]